MRFFVTGEQNRQSILNTIVLLFLGYVALLWISNGMMYFHKMGLNPQSVVEYYLGSEERFTQPKSVDLGSLAAIHAAGGANQDLAGGLDVRLGHCR